MEVQKYLKLSQADINRVEEELRDYGIEGDLHIQYEGEEDAPRAIPKKISDLDLDLVPIIRLYSMTAFETMRNLQFTEYLSFVKRLGKLFLMPDFVDFGAAQAFNLHSDYIELNKVVLSKANSLASFRGIRSSIVPVEGTEHSILDVKSHVNELDPLHEVWLTEMRLPTLKDEDAKANYTVGVTSMTMALADWEKHNMPFGVK